MGSTWGAGGTRGFLEEKAEWCQCLRATPTPPHAASHRHTQGCPAPCPVTPCQGILGRALVGGVRERQEAQLLRWEGMGLQAWMGHHSAMFGPPTSITLLSFPPAVTRLRDVVQGPGHRHPAATPGASAQGSKCPTAPHHTPRGRQGTRDSQGPGRPRCPWSSPSPGLASGALRVPGPPWRPPDSPGNGHRLLSGLAQPPGTRECLTAPLAGGKGGGRPGSRALTLSPHLRGRRVPGPSLEQGRRPGLPLSNRLRTARRVNPEQLRVQGAWLAPRGGRLLCPHKAVRGGTQARADYSGSHRAARHLGAWRPWPCGSHPSLDSGPPGCLPPTSPAPAQPHGMSRPPTRGQWQGHAEAAPPSLSPLLRVTGLGRTSFKDLQP